MIALAVGLDRAAGGVEHAAVELDVLIADAADDQPLFGQVERVLGEDREAIDLGGDVLPRREIGGRVRREGAAHRV